MPRGIPKHGLGKAAPKKTDGAPHRILRQPLAALRLAKLSKQWKPVVITESKRSYETFSVFEARVERNGGFSYFNGDAQATLTTSEIKAILAVPVPPASVKLQPLGFAMLASGVAYSPIPKIPTFPHKKWSTEADDD
jgi:hypothetical protein